MRRPRRRRIRRPATSPIPACYCSTGQRRDHVQRVPVGVQPPDAALPRRRSDLSEFGHSDRPPLRYSASLYESFVADAAHDLVDRPTVGDSSLTGAYVVAGADRATSTGGSWSSRRRTPSPGSTSCPANSFGRRRADLRRRRIEAVNPVQSGGPRFRGSGPRP